MSSASSSAGLGSFKWSSLLKHSDLLFTGALFGTVVLLVLPVPTMLLDLLLTASIGTSLLMLLVIIYVKEPSEFSAFPTLLLAVTLFRLALNVASTRLILLHGYAGQVIQSFGQFVVQGNYLVGMVVFFILVVINFIVITKGAGRIAEVAARFTLDALPGKQMAIDAEMNAGLIDEATATARRRKVQKEADFYGAMDGANKFVRGDAMAAILITFINVVGGFAIGVIQQGISPAEAAQKYMLLSIGDGLVSQVPALIISIAAGLLVTRTADDSNLSAQVGRQLLAYPKALAIGAGMLLFFSVMPGLPTVPFMALGGLAAFAAHRLNKRPAQALTALPPAAGKGGAAGTKALADAKSPSKDVNRTIDNEIFCIELGIGLLRLADATAGGDLLDRVTGVRRNLGRDAGLVIPPIAIRDNAELEPGEYRFLLRGKTMGRGTIVAHRLLAMNVSGSKVPLKGIPTIEPVFGLEAVWIAEEERRTAEINGYTLVDAASVLITHIYEIRKNCAHLILSRQDVQIMVDQVKEGNPALVAELLPDLVTLGLLQRVLQNLMREGVPVKHLTLIFEAVADFAGNTKSPDELSEFVRRRLGTYFVGNYEASAGVVKGLTLDPRLENTLASRLHRTPIETTLALDANTAQHLARELTARTQTMAGEGLTPILLVNSEVRLPLKRFFEGTLPRLVVLAYQELPMDLEVQAFGIIQAPRGAIEATMPLQAAA
jgi:flagellar biosynthesis protein FlhA